MKIHISTRIEQREVATAWRLANTHSLIGGRRPRKRREGAAPPRRPRGGWT